MGAPDIIFQLRKKGYSICADGGYLDISPAEDLAPEIVEQLKQNKQEILTQLEREAQEEAQQDARRQRAIDMLEANPEIQRAIVPDLEADPGYVILTIAVRNVASCEVRIARDRYDPFQLLNLLHDTSQATH